LKVDSLSREWTGLCAGSEFQVNGAETENAGERKLVVILEGQARNLSWKNARSGWKVGLVGD